MKTIVILTLFVGMFLIVQGVFEEKLKAAENNKKVVYKFIPKTYYEEQMEDSNVTGKMANIFNKTAPWFDRIVGETLIPDKSKVDPFADPKGKNHK